MNNYYSVAFNYLNSLDERVKGLLNKKWWFCFQYFSDNSPGNIDYIKLPKNNLVLESINKGSNNFFNIDEVSEYARLLDVDAIPVIFKGILDEKTIEIIKYFLNTSENDLEYIFGESSFIYFFYKLLNPQINNSFLMSDNNFNDNIQKLVIKTFSNDVSFEILNPLYKRVSSSNNTDFIETYTLIILNFLIFCQSVDFNEIKFKGSKREDVYLYIICKIFNIYLSEAKDDLLAFEFAIPSFFDENKFQINIELLPNTLTKKYLKENNKLEYYFKIILGSFNKKIKTPIGIFEDATVKIFNNYVDLIQTKIDEYFNKKAENELSRRGLLNFGDYFSINYSKDGDGEVYPDIYTAIKDYGADKKKKKGVMPQQKNGSTVEFEEVTKK